MAHLDRYSRQTNILGDDGQERLASARITIAGLGGLGSPASTYLAEAGVGHLKIVDPDRVSISDLNRQFLYTDEDVGERKSVIAQEALKMMNEEIKVESHSEKMDEKNLPDFIEGSDVVIDCLDNWKARLALNGACVEMSIPLVHGTVGGMFGQVTTIIPKETPCLNCIFRERVDETSVQVIGFAPGVIGSIQAGEAIKLLTGVGETLREKLLIVDLKYCSFETIKISRDIGCGICGD